MAVNARHIIPLHDIENQDKLDALVESMENNGWQGRPLIVHDDGNGYWAWTGSHRIIAARITATPVPVYWIDMDKLSEFCTEWDMTFDELATEKDRLWAIEEIGDSKALELMQQEMATAGKGI